MITGRIHDWRCRIHLYYRTKRNVRQSGVTSNLAARSWWRVKKVRDRHSPWSCRRLWKNPWVH